MDELEISGKRYISTRRAAREHGYHSDYMGQLIRSKKVSGQKVGRAWYIEEDSLVAYLGHEPQKKEEVQVTEPAKITQETQPQSVPQAPEPQPIEVIQKEPEIVEVLDALKEKEEEPNSLATAAAQALHPEPEKESVTETTFEHHPVAEPLATEEKSTRIPIHIPASAIQDIGGLRYAADDAPSLPPIVRMPQIRTQAEHSEPIHAMHAASTRHFPVISLSVVGALAILVALFASQFVSTTIISEPGKSAIIKQAIHW